jgi:hypothetical protein
MKDDIKPSVNSTPKFSDNQNIETEAKLVEPPEEVINSFANLNNQQPNLDKQEDGFVILPSTEDKPAKKFPNPFEKLKNLSKKQKIISAVILLIIFAGLGGGAYALTKPKPKAAAYIPPTPVVKKEEPPKPTTEASKLSGVQVPIGTNQKPVVSIQIENSPDARPQSGLNEASVVYEAIAEGGITRFNASFLDNSPEYIGPIRSVRPYYAQLAAPFDPIFVHAGGSADGLSMLASLGLKDFDHGPNGSYFQRINERYAPHNLYSGMSQLRDGASKRGYTTSDTKSFTRKAEKTGLTPTAKTVDIAISGPLYNVHYDYDGATNTYKRVMAGKPHTDLKSGAQLSPKVVIGMVAPYSQNGIYSVYQILGTGTAFIFQDGQVNQVTWSKPDAKTQIKFTDSAGQDFGIDPGQTWITLAKTPSDIAYAP